MKRKKFFLDCSLLKSNDLPIWKKTRALVFMIKIVL